MAAEATPSEGATLPISTAPAAGQLITHNGKTLTTIKEGLAYILVPPDAPLVQEPTKEGRDTQGKATVFYNPIQQYNRDLTVLAIRAFGEDFVVRQQAQRGQKSGRGEGKKKRQAKKQKQKQNVEDPPAVDTTAATQAIAANEAKRKRELDDSQEDSRDTVKKVRLEQKADEAVPSSAVSADTRRWLEKEEEDNDDSFNDGGIADEDLMVAEENVMKSFGSFAAPAEEPTPVGNTQVPNQGDTTADDNNGPGKSAEASPEKKKKHEHKVHFTILDALSATGLRALRYAKEIPFVTKITANDLSPGAVESIKTNIEHNGLQEADIICPTTGNALHQMYTRMGKENQLFTVIDLDPYGTAVPFLDGAVQAVANGGLLCVTCTDTAVFNSTNYPEKVFSLYGGVSAKGDMFAEVGLRLILNSIATCAAKYSMTMEPLLSLSIDYYARVFVRLRKSPAEVKFLGGKTMVVYNCDSGCGAFSTQPMVRNSKQDGKKGSFYWKHSRAQAPTAGAHCEHCGLKTHLAGPMYGGPLHNPDFIRRVLDIAETADPEVYGTLTRVHGMLTTALEETSLYPTSDEGASSGSANDKVTVPNPESTNLVPYRTFNKMPAHLVDVHPFYIVPSSISRVLKCVSPSLAELRGALIHLGYKCERSHAAPGSIKTEAPWSVIWQVMREWVKQRAPIKEGTLRKGMAGWRILHPGEDPDEKKDERANGSDAGDWEEVLQEGEAELKVVKGDDGTWRVLKRKITAAGTTDVLEPKQEPALPEIKFDARLGGKGWKDRSVVRYQQNPRENWGPMARAKK